MNLLLIPGFGETTYDSGYDVISKYAQELHYNIIPLNIKWDRTTLVHWMEQARAALENINTKDTILLGFSFGSMISLLLTQEYDFKHVIICSLSPYFKDDLPLIPDSAKKFFGRRRIEAFLQYETPHSSKTPATFLFGDQDWKHAILKSREIARDWKPSANFKLIEGVGHELDQPPYISVLRDIIKELVRS